MPSDKQEHPDDRNGDVDSVAHRSDRDYWVCPFCGERDTEQVEEEHLDLSENHVRRFACQTCCGGWEVEFAPVRQEGTHEPKEVTPDAE